MPDISGERAGGAGDLKQSQCTEVHVSAQVVTGGNDDIVSCTEIQELQIAINLLFWYKFYDIELPPGLKQAIYPHLRT